MSVDTRLCQASLGRRGAGVRSGGQRVGLRRAERLYYNKCCTSRNPGYQNCSPPKKMIHRPFKLRIHSLFGSPCINPSPHKSSSILYNNLLHLPSPSHPVFCISSISYNCKSTVCPLPFIPFSFRQQESNHLVLAASSLLPQGFDTQTWSLPECLCLILARPDQGIHEVQLLAVTLSAARSFHS